MRDEGPLAGLVRQRNNARTLPAHSVFVKTDAALERDRAVHIDPRAEPARYQAEPHRNHVEGLVKLRLTRRIVRVEAAGAVRIWCLVPPDAKRLASGLKAWPDPTA